MSHQPDKPFTQRTAVVSLVAALTCAFANDAAASRPAVTPNSGETELSARVASLAKRLQALEPALLRDLENSPKIAQWRNR
jgi:hypothetical protein